MKKLNVLFVAVSVGLGVLPVQAQNYRGEALVNSADRYVGAVKWYIADLKPSFPQDPFYTTQTALTEANYRAVLDGLKNKVGVNGIRMPMLPDAPQEGAYSTLYKDVYDYAHQIGLAIYASPCSTGMTNYPNWSPQRYAQWVARYVNYYHPDFVSPFNESALSVDQMTQISSQLRILLTGSHTRIVGPDDQHVETTLQAFTQDPSLMRWFDTVSSHDANNDTTATQNNWTSLVSITAGEKPVWASEDPQNWGAGTLPGIAQAVNGGVQGIVVWMAKPGLIDDAGNPSAKAMEIREHLFRP